MAALFTSKRLSRTALCAVAMSWVAACHPTSSNSDANVESSSSSNSKPLPISGVWQATDVWASKQESDGTLKPVRASSEDLKNGLWRVQIDLNSEGSGFMQGLVKCKGPADATSTPSRVKPYQALNAMFGLMNLVNLIRRTMDEFECANSPNAVLSSLVPVSPSRNFFGQPMDSVAKNLGVVGEEKSLYAVDNECRKLRGMRLVNVQNASACVGFTDATANKIRFLIIPVGEIHAIRVNMKRD